MGIVRTCLVHHCFFDETIVMGHRVPLGIAAAESRPRWLPASMDLNASCRWQPYQTKRSARRDHAGNSIKPDRSKQVEELRPRVEAIERYLGLN